MQYLQGSALHRRHDLSAVKRGQTVHLVRAAVKVRVVVSARALHTRGKNKAKGLQYRKRATDASASTSLDTSEGKRSTNKFPNCHGVMQVLGSELHRQRLPCRRPPRYPHQQRRP